MSAILHHKDFLLNDAEIVTGLQFDDFDGGKLLHACRSCFTAVTTSTIAAAAIAIVCRGWLLQDSTCFVDIAVGPGSDPLQKINNNITAVRKKPTSLICQNIHSQVQEVSKSCLLHTSY